MSKNTKFICPKCKAEIDIDEFIKEGVKEEIGKELSVQEQKYKEELEKVKAEKSSLIDDFSKKEDEIKKQLEKEFKFNFSKKEEEFKKKILNEQQEAQQELEEELKEKTNQLKEMNKLKTEKAKLEREKDSLAEELEAKFEQKLNDNLANEKIKIKQQLESAHELKLLEYQKQLDDQKLLIEEMKRKHEQGSMQLQGEIQEIAIENWLKEKFILDEIQEVGKGDMGADCLQIVNTREKLNCGKIYYESKRTKRFSANWIGKFKDDIKEKGADVGVLVTQVYPEEMDRMGIYDGIFVCSYDEFKGLSFVLRENIIKISYVAKSQENKKEKAELLYTYLTSTEFSIQVEGIIKSFITMKNDIEIEKAAFQKQWKKREKQLENVISSTSSMIGSIQGIAGTAIESAETFLSIPMIED